MNTYKFDFMLSAWVQQVEIEADSYEEAEQLLNEMSVSEIAREGYIKTSEISDVDCECEEEEEDDYYEED